MEGQILGNRYELLEKIGGGGMARVYRSKCKLLNRHVAVKILRKDFANDDEFIRRFRIEAQASASLSHPNIVSIHDVGMEDETHYIVMEYVDGITLKDYIKSNDKLDWSETVNIGRQICSAIDHAHKNGIVHRDIKPHNILYNSEGIAKVTDFGIARAAAFSSVTVVGSTIGSVHYFSPEQARGGYTDEKSDIYSLGVVLYEMITGSLPFDGDSPVSIALKHVQNEPREPIQINPDVPKGLNSVIMNALKKDQNIRYQTAAEFLNDLNLVLKDPDEDYARIDTEVESQTRRVPIVGDKNQNEDRDKIKKVKTEKKKRRGKAAVILGLLSAIIIIPIFAFLSMQYVVPAIFGQAADEFVFRDYTGDYVGRVKMDLEDRGIEVIESRVFDEEFPRNTIISQSRQPGESVRLTRLTTRIELVVSDGPERLEMPDYVLQDYRGVRIALSQLGLDYEMKKIYDSNVPNGKVVSTKPPYRAIINSDSVIEVFVSKGPEERYTMVPYLIGKTRQEAYRIIGDANLSLGKISPDISTNNTDVVVEQSPEPNAQVREGSPVTLIFDTPTTSSSQEVQIQRHTIRLERAELFPEDINVLVKLEFEGSMEDEIVMDDVYRKGDFPLTVSVPKPVGQRTQTVIYVDGLEYLRS